MELLPFSDFYSQLSTERLAKIYEGLTHETLSRMLNRVKSTTEHEKAALEELLEQLPSIIFDIAAVVSTHLLHEYHEWLAQHQATSSAHGR
ncbi:MAG: hypothetical protein K6T81_19695 [Alicyclobacillus macrosporangiidus]|uniref:hypothetical protein n=1 Tax=Alicyclobacillus macrosporangiidus TaxID=392015 RepID=UPI0026EEE628|nr:hypothetical protein [Alicyclobacillus macrosporangiidus]MCL6600935.1 hypothetical protein [Alicyclobacillus macrosporangiidus]